MQSLIRLATAVGGIALSSTAGAGVASGDPDPFIDTTCSYSQVVAALNAQDPAAAAQFNESHRAQSYLRRFLAAPPEQRQQIIQQVQSSPQGQQYLGTIQQVAGTCNNY